MGRETFISPPAADMVSAASEAMPGQSCAEAGNDMVCLQRLPIQRKLQVGATDDPMEVEADAMADKVMRMPEASFIQRKCAHCEEEERGIRRAPLLSFIRKKGSNSDSDSGHTADDEVSNAIQSTRGGGSSLPEETRQFMEHRFGAGFSDVHVHTGDQAAQLSDRLNARAFTIGNDIYFNRGMYDPGSAEGKRLMAHELTHVVQQGAADENTVRRDDRVDDYTDKVFFNRPVIETSAFKDTSGGANGIGGYNYWYRKLNAVYEVQGPVLAAAPAGMQMGTAAWNVILAKAWELRPAALPAAGSAPVKKTAVVQVRMIATPPALDKPFSAHCAFTYSYDATKGKPVFQLLLSEFTADKMIVPATAGVTDKDYADFLLEEDQQKHPGATEKPGAIKGLDTIADADERRIIKNIAVELYINETTTAGVTQRTLRNTEIDQVIPISTNTADPSKTVFYYYTFIFHKPDAAGLVDIEVKRIGKKGDTVVGDPDLPLITRIPGYMENAFDAAKAETPDKLVKWIQERYKATITEAEIKAPTVKEITEKTNALIATRCTTPEWFKKNYAIIVMDAATAKTRLKTFHKYTDAELAGVKDYTTGELTMVELSLERMSLPVLKRLNTVFLARQDASIKVNPGQISGLTQGYYLYNATTKVLTTGQSNTITMYDGAFAKADAFLGGVAGVNPTGTRDVTHELGHAVGNTLLGNKQSDPTIQSQFNKFVKDLGLTAVTTYARGNTGIGSTDTEYFPEAFMLFNDDPEWLFNNQYQTYTWFLYLQQTGTAPALDVIKKIISAWDQQKASGAAVDMQSAATLVARWTAFVKKANKQPGADDIKTFF